MPHGITQCYLPPGRGDLPACVCVCVQVPRGPAADGRRGLRDIVPRRARAPVDPRGVRRGRRQVLVQCREQGRTLTEQRRTRRQRYRSTDLIGSLYSVI